MCYIVLCYNTLCVSLHLKEWLLIRMSKLTDIVGWADYIINEKQQEHIIVEHSYADWKPYQEYERRELIIALPNEWQHLSEIELTYRMNMLAQKFFLINTIINGQFIWIKKKQIYTHIWYSLKGHALSSLWVYEIGTFTWWTTVKWQGEKLTGRLMRTAM